MSPIEGIGGAAEKVAPLVKFPVLMRVVFPGALAALCIYPFIQGWTGFASKILPLSPHWSSLLFAAAAVCVLGTLVSGLRSLTYKVYSYHLLWPRWLFQTLRNRQESRVQSLLAEQRKLDRGDARYDEIWQTLRLYPVNDKGNSYASHPTLLGNIIAAYEKYPWTRYGMDSVFYWPRIWLLVEREKKEEIDASWSLADGLLSLSAVAFGGGLGWVAGAIAGPCGFCRLRAGPPLNAPLTAALSSFGLLFLGYFLYRFSLGFHLRNGENFKAIFDLYRKQLNPMLFPGREKIAQEIVQWKETWAYLQYLAFIPEPPSEPPQFPPKPTLVTSDAPPPP